jgi:REP element-mobilizing transposase RayT
LRASKAHQRGRESFLAGIKGIKDSHGKMVTLYGSYCGKMVTLYGSYCVQRSLKQNRTSQPGAVERFRWRLFAFALMTNHLHLVLKTPQPNLSKGMQWLLSSYANAWAQRHRFAGHELQGRYRTELVEDETYLWVLSRYVHLNSLRAGLVTEPEAWP